MKPVAVCTGMVLAFGIAANIVRAQAAASDPDRVRELVRQLDSGRFAARDRADRELRRLGKDALQLVEQELKATKSEEVRQRLTRIIYLWTQDEKMAALAKAREQQIVTLVAGLNAPLYRDREKATKELMLFGKEALPILQSELTRPAEVETRRRLEAIIRKLSS